MEEEILFKIEIPGGSEGIRTLENLTKANKALREERKKLDLDSAAGQARAKEINKTLDENTEAIKENSSSLEKQRLNVGNYTGALDKLVPGLGATVNGFKDMTKSAIAFIATPIGAVIGAIGLALGALMAYFKGSEKGQNDLNKVVAVGSALFEQLMNVVEAVGEVIFNAISNPKQAIIDFGNLIKENFINRFNGILELIPQLSKAVGLLFEGKFSEAGKVAFDAVGKVTLGVDQLSAKIQNVVNETANLVQEGIKNGEELARLQRQIDRDERKLIIERAETNLEVAKLRREAITQEGDEKRKTINEAIALEEKLSEAEVKAKQRLLAQAVLESKAEGDTKEAKLKVAQAIADVTAAEAQRYEATLRFAKEIEKLNEEEAERLQKRLDAEKEREEKEKEKRQAQIDAIEAGFNKNNENAQKARDKKIKDDAVKDKKELDEKKKAFESLNSLVRQQTIAGKGLAIGAATVNTYQGATEILKQKSTLPSPFDFITKAINFAATIAAGLGAVKSITGVGFEKGGILGGVLRGPSHAMGGIPFSVGGRVGFEAEGGEVIINRNSSAMFRSQLSRINQAGGGRAFAVGGVTNEVARVSESSVSQREVFDAIARIRPVVTVEDINLGQASVDVIESRAQVV